MNIVLPDRLDHHSVCHHVVQLKVSNLAIDVWYENRAFFNWAGIADFLSDFDKKWYK